jgi:SprT protein
MLPKQKETLARFLPVEAVEYIIGLLTRNHIQLKISRGRVTKLGDFRPRVNGSPHRITVNGTLNVYAFLLVFLHELAHVYVWEQFGGKAAPHGREWKQQYGTLIREHVSLGFFHPALHEQLMEFSFHVKAAGIGHASLARALRMFDHETETDGLVFLEEVPGQSYFVAANGRRFKKEQRLRKRYRCLCLDNNRNYLFHPMARVTVISQDAIIE